MSNNFRKKHFDLLEISHKFLNVLLKSCIILGECIIPVFKEEDTNISKKIMVYDRCVFIENFGSILRNETQ